MTQQSSAEQEYKSPHFIFLTGPYQICVLHPFVLQFSFYFSFPLFPMLKFCFFLKNAGNLYVISTFVLTVDKQNMDLLIFILTSICNNCER